ncbi:ATP-binding protein [Actinomadura gamaensis]|uniref:ATP-binding protein n=1 Tax=Actinomadura gamaensis TaxID=1763541 RepID=A0ABV9TU07_9ACTN
MRAQNPADLPYGGACAWPLPSDERCAHVARAALRRAMEALRFDTDALDSAELAVSELATNALQHAASRRPLPPHSVSELAIWARLSPRPELVISVFDLDRQVIPRPGDGPLLAEGGRGMTIVGAVTSGWGSHPSRSRLAPQPRSGKAVWMAMPLPSNWPRPTGPIFPAVAAQRLTMNLSARGVATHRTTESTGISLVDASGLNIWVRPSVFSWTGPNGTCHGHPLIDLQETTEHIIATLDSTNCPTVR